MYAPVCPPSRLHPVRPSAAPHVSFFPRLLSLFSLPLATEHDLCLLLEPSNARFSPIVLHHQAQELNTTTPASSIGNRLRMRASKKIKELETRHWRRFSSPFFWGGSAPWGSLTACLPRWFTRLFQQRQLDNLPLHDGRETSSGFDLLHASALDCIT